MILTDPFLFGSDRCCNGVRRLLLACLAVLTTQHTETALTGPEAPGLSQLLEATVPEAKPAQTAG
jgi:hypothetical protein